MDEGGVWGRNHKAVEEFVDDEIDRLQPIHFQYLSSSLSSEMCFSHSTILLQGNGELPECLDKLGVNSVHPRFCRWEGGNTVKIFS